MNESFAVESCSPEAIIVRVGKTLDFRNAAQFKDMYQEQLDRGILRFILDFSETGILDSTGLGSIFSLYRQLSTQNGQILFASPSHPVQTVLQLTRTYKIFHLFPTVESACRALAAHPSTP